MKEIKEIQRFALPLIANQYFNLVMNQLILYLAVNRSLENLAGITTISSLLYALGGILGTVALAFNIEGGQRIGKSETRGFLQLLKSSLLLNSLVGLVFAGATLIFGSLFLRGMYGFSGQLLHLTHLYLVIQSPYIFLTLMLFLSSNLIKIENKTSLIMVSSVVSMGFELLLNLLLVRMFQMGIIGAGIASIFSLFVSVVLQFFFVRQKIKAALCEKATALKQLIQKSIPLGGQELLEGVIFTLIFDALMAREGLEILAIYNLCLQLLNLVKMPTYMYENAITVFVSKAYGEKNERKMHHVFRVSVLSSIAFYLVFSLLIFINGNRFALLFSSKLSRHFSEYLLIALICSLFFVTYESLKGMLQAINQEKYVLYRTFLINVILFTVLLLSRIFITTNFTFLYVLYGISLLILSVIFYRKYRKIMTERTI